MDDIAIISDTQSFDTFAFDTDNSTRQEFLIDDFVIQDGAVAPIPEPTSVAMLISGLAFVAWRRRVS